MTLQMQDVTANLRLSTQPLFKRRRFGRLPKSLKRFQEDFPSGTLRD